MTNIIIARLEKETGLFGIVTIDSDNFILVNEKVVCAYSPEKLEAVFKAISAVL